MHRFVVLATLLFLVGCVCAHSVELTPEQKLDNLRAVMKQYSIWAYIVPTADSHMSEYVSSSDQRRAYISGFDGSAGTALITMDSALLWTDGRYWKQAENQLDFRYWKLMKDRDVSLTTWLLLNVKENATVGVDPFLYSVNLIWTTRPSAPNGTIFELDIKFSGRSTSDKLASVRQSMKGSVVDFYIITALDEIAWLLNLRGADIEYNTVFFSYLIVTLNEAYVYVDETKFESSSIKANLKKLMVHVKPYQSYIDDVTILTQQSGGSIAFIDPVYCNYATYSAIKATTIKEDTSFVRYEKAIKNDVERTGFKNCHLRDGAAVVSYLAWLEDELKKGKTINEYEGAEKLESFRANGDYFLRPSFETISCYGENAAIIHYAPTKENHADIGTSNVYLLDSGGQYLDGTTDITRTVHFGTPTEHVKRSFTRVLQGQLALSSLVFPSGLTGDKMDAFARYALWKDGLNYNHGSGHGVGHCLDVHEGPHGIGVPRFGFKEHYDVTIEPGYYENGNFGIRIENLYLVRQSETLHNFENRTYLEFEQITFCPLQPSMIDTSLLSEDEISQVNQYNQQVRDQLQPLLSHNALAIDYLLRNTVLIKKDTTIDTNMALLLSALILVSLLLIVSIIINLIQKYSSSKKNQHQIHGEMQALSEEMD